MSGPFTFHVPADARYCMLAPELAGKYAELAGGTAADAAALATALSSAMADLATRAKADADFDLSYRVRAGDIEITVRCAGHSAVVRHPLSVPNL